MRFLHLRIENLASLYGTNEVDFEHGLDGAPIFLVTGPTGAGKSTLMDAISLALFGRTPRLREKKGDDETDSRLAMSRGTGMSSVVLTFSKIEGGRARRYRAGWSCHRAHQKAEGKLQDPRRSIERSEDDGTWKLLGSGQLVKEYDAAFKEVLEGLTAEDFERSILLAQGEFTAFLRATESDRAAILERLTNTAVYKEIGRRAAERRRDAQEAYDRVHGLVAGVELAPEEDEKRWGDELDEAAMRGLALRAQHAEAAAARQWVETRATLALALVRANEAVAARRSAIDAERTELERLAEDARCGAAAPLLETAMRLEGERDALTAALPDLRDKVGKLAADHAGALVTHAAAAEASRAVDARVAAGQPELVEARALRLRKAAADTELAKAAALVAGADEQVAALERDQGHKEQTRKDATAALAEASRERAKVEAARPLVEEVAGLRVKLETVARARKELDALGAKRAKDAAKHAKDAEALAKHGEALARAQGEVARLATARGEAEAALGAALEGSADARARRDELRHRAEALTTRGEALREARRIDAEVARRSTEATSFAEELDAAATGVRRHEDAIAVASDQARVARETLGIQDQRLADLRWALGIAEHRSRLRHGEACALCGSEAHPFVEDRRFADHDREVAARVAELEAAHAEAARELTEAEARRSRSEADRAALAATRDALANRHAESTRALERARAALDAPLGAIGLGGAVVDGAAFARVEGEILAARAELQAATTRLDDVEAAVASGRDAHEAALRAVAALVTTVATSRAVLEALAATITTETLAEATAKAALEADEGALGDALTMRGVATALRDGHANLAAGVAEAERLVAAIRAADQAFEKATKGVADATGALELAAAALSTKRDDAKQLATLRAQRAAIVAELAPAVAAALGGADPDEVERHRSAEVAAARKAAELAAGRAGEIERELAAARTRSEGVETRLGLAMTAAIAAATALDAALQVLGLADRAALRLRLLDDAERRRLAAREKELQDALTADTAKREAAMQNGAEHDARRPPGLADGRDAASLAEELATLAGELARADEVVADRRVRIAAQTAARAKRAEHEATLAAARGELDIWQRLHGLIGVNEGEEFKRYAQLHNLDLLLAKANHHLRELAPRYELVGAEAAGVRRLAFAIRDRWQAGRERPLTTLSGGESFLVSLALALGLADFRAVRMPIETLLLDEGFGTLDRETLGAAMNALQALNARGTQVGIISHVEGLRDAIPAHVIVDRQGGGRSTVRVVGGR